MSSHSRQPSIVYEDNHLIALCKPAAMPVVPDSSSDYSLLQWAKDYIRRTKGKTGNVFLAVIHRIDRPVSGLVLFARTSKAASRLSDQMRRRLVVKRYVAVVHGRPHCREGAIETLLWKDRRRNRVFVVPQPSPGAKEAITKWSFVAERKGASLLILEPVTGRPHQLRVHSSQVLGCPIVGDFKYGSKERVLSGRAIALHSWRMEVIHPTRKVPLVLECMLPGHGPFGWFREDRDLLCLGLPGGDLDGGADLY